MFCLDSSLIVAVLAAERNSDRAEAWLAGQAADVLAVNGWVEVEVSAALAAKLRAGDFDTSLHKQAARAFSEMRGSLGWLRIGAVHFERAANLAGEAGAKLRGGDALHLAVAAEHGAVLATLDKRQAEAGAALGIPTLLV